MPRNLTLRQRLVHFDGSPTVAAKLALAAAVAVAFIAAFLVRASGDEQPAGAANPIPERHLAREVQTADTGLAAPALSPAAALPVLRRPVRAAPRPRAAPAPEPAVVAQPVATPEPTAEPVSTPAPAPTAAPLPPPPPPPPAARPPAPPPPPPAGDTFDSSG